MSDPTDAHPPDVEMLFAQAIREHEAGRLAEAEQYYVRILNDQPDYAEALHHLGVIRHQQGRHDDALIWIGRALTLDNSKSSYYSNQALALRALGKIDEAIAQLEQAIRLDPDYAIAHKNLGVTLNQIGRTRSAAHHLGQAAQLNPQDSSTHRSLGAVLLKLGQAEAALEAFQRAVALMPEDGQGVNDLGVVLNELGRYDEAVATYQRALQLSPDTAETHNNLGISLSKQNKLDEAILCFRQAMALRPDFLDAQHNLAVALRDLGEVETALPLITHVVQQDPGNVEARNNLGVTLQARGDFAAAREQYEQVLRIQPDHFWSRFNRANLLLMSGDFAQGWLEFEWRWRRPTAAPRHFDKPLWDGSEAQTLLLHTEQGFGDTLQFVRFAAVVKQRVEQVILECQPALIPLLSRCDGIDQLIPRGDVLPHFDCYAPLVSTPGILRSASDSLGEHIPYLHADQQRISEWRMRLPDVGQRVGIAWQGNPEYARDRLRSIPLSYFGALAQAPQVELISLQKGLGTEQLRDIDFSVHDFGEALDASGGAFMDTAAVMANLDLIITSDTATAHLAGGLGLRVWVALGFSPDWRWGMSGDTCPWYPTMRLFRQTQLGDWAGVFQRMRDELLQQGC